MLSHLTIRDLALVDRVDLPFGPGLNVLTGETGAGKSVLVGALSIVLGARANSDAVRSGAKEAVVEALFDVPPGSRLAARLEATGVEASDGQLVVRRVIAPGGRGRVHLNGQLATVTMLAELLAGVVELTGQHEHVSLLDPEQHVEFLDGFGGHERLRAEFAAAHARVVELGRERADLERRASDRAQREDYLRFALDEIEACSPEPGELEALEGERRRLRSVTELIEGVGRAEALLGSGEGAAIEQLGRVEAALERLVPLDPSLSALLSSALEVVAGAEELSRALGRHLEALELDPERLEEVEERVEALRRLCKKYGGSEPAVLECAARMRSELDALENHEARLEALESAEQEARARRDAVAGRLSKARAKAAKALAGAIRRELEALSMAGTRIEVTLRRLPEPGPKGAEAAELELSANPGEPLRPLRKCASGGELSRVLLAIKNVLAQRGAVVSHVFDEVDTGIGGAVAEVVGAKLKAVADGAQVIAVTHLPQVAAYADHHVRVKKVVEGGRTLTRIERLDEGARVEELARMVGGVEITDRTRGLAEELRTRGRGRPAPPRGEGEARPSAPKRRPKRVKAGRRRGLEAVP